MKSQSRVVTVIQYLALAVMLGGTFMPFDHPWRGWVIMLAFGVCGILFAAGLTKMPPRSERAFGAYMFACAAAFGLPQVWTQRPAWWDPCLTAVLFAIVAWLCVASLRDRQLERPSS